MTLEEASKEIKKIIVKQVLEDVWNETNCGVYDTTDIPCILHEVAMQYDIFDEIDIGYRERMDELLQEYKNDNIDI